MRGTLELGRVDAVLGEYETEIIDFESGFLADLAALVDPSVVIIHGAPEHADPLRPVLQRVLNEVLPGAQVAPPALGDKAALLGAMKAAAIVAYEGERAYDES